MSSRFGLSAPVLSLIAAVIVVGIFIVVQIGGSWGSQADSQPMPTESELALGAARDAQRRADVNTMLNATHQYAIDHDGTFPQGVSETPTEICGTIQEDDGSYSAVPMEDCVNLFPAYKDILTRIPSDPQAPEGRTWYRISRTADGKINVMADTHDGNASISVTR